MNSTNPYRVMLVLSDVQDVEAWVTLALKLAGDAGDVVIRGLITIPESVSLSEGAVRARQWRDTVDPYTRKHDIVEEDIRVYVDHRPMTHVFAELPAANVNLLLVQWNGPVDETGGFSTEDILQNAVCDVALLNGSGWDTNGPVLLSLRGGPNITLGVQLAKALSGDSTITLFHAADTRFHAPDLEVVMRAEPKITRSITAVTGLDSGILREAVGHKAIVMGAGFRRPEGAHADKSPSTLHAIYEKTQLPLMLVRARRPEELEFHAPYLISSAHEDISKRVDRWFAENTFDSSEFADLEALVALKQKRGVTISVGLPALNEEETVEKVITTLKRALMDELPLVDEFVLIDSNSTDNTVAIAEQCGIPVYRHPEILPEIGMYRGKGEALWKSLHVLKGDIVAWVDTDITNIHPRFIYGLLGPLLKHPHLQFVKGFYQRPIKVGEKMQAYGGGRVTELVARPMFNLFYPELSGIIQPLSGEYAGRRAALEQIPFFTGYGVETGMLLDILERFGLDAIAQTDLEVRVHHNQPLVSLSKMAFAILQVFIARMESRSGVQLLDLANRSMKLIIQEPDRFALEVAEIGDVERPPMISVPAYQEIRRSLIGK